MGILKGKREEREDKGIKRHVYEEIIYNFRLKWGKLEVVIQMRHSKILTYENDNRKGNLKDI